MARHSKVLEVVGCELFFFGCIYRITLPESVWPDTSERLVLEQHLDLLDQTKLDSYFIDTTKKEDDD